MTQEAQPFVSTSVSEVTCQLIHDKVVKWLRKEARNPVDSIDFDASILKLGVDSLGAATIALELERETNKQIDPDFVFELDTIKELAEYLDSLPTRKAKPAGSPQAPSREAPTPEPVPVEGQIAAGGLLDQYALMNRRVRSLQDEGLYFFDPEISQHDGAWVVANGKRMLMLASYEYLGLLGHPHLTESANSTIEEYGTGHHGVRLLAGTTPVHRRLEKRLAEFMRADDAIVFSSGYVTNLTVISTLVGPGDYVVGDQWNHASIADGCRFSGAEFLEFQHNDMGSLAQTLQQTNGRRTLVVVDAVFSMDGDIIDLPRVVECCRQHGALLMVDEAHSLGVLGETGRGIQEHFDMEPGSIDVKMGTLSKALAGLGGFVATNEEISTFLRHHARGYIFSGALPAGQASVAIAALDVMANEPDLMTRLWRNTDHYLTGLKKLGFDTGNSITPIVPVMTRTNDVTMEMTRICRDQDLFVVPVCYPAVPADSPRLRTCVSAIHTPDDINMALEVLGRAGKETGVIR